MAGLSICSNKQFVMRRASYIYKCLTCDLESWVSCSHVWLLMKEVTMPRMHSFLCVMVSSSGCGAQATTKRRDNTNSINITNNCQYIYSSMCPSIQLYEWIIQQQVVIIIRMIRLRSKFLHLASNHGKYELSIVKHSFQKHEILSMNPLARKSFQQINRIVTTTTPRTQMAICGFALSAMYAHLLANRSKAIEYSAKDHRLKQDIVNTCLSKIFSNFDKVTPEELSNVIQLMILTYEVRGIRIKQQNLNIYRKNIPELLRIHLKNDQQQGRYAQNFKRIFYSMLKVGKRYVVLKSLLEYLIKHDLKTNQECLKFFNSIATIHNNGFYDHLVESVVIKYIDAKQNTLDNYRQWLKPVLADVIKIFCIRSRVQNEPYGKKYLAALLKQAQCEETQINQQIGLFTRLADWSIQFNHQPLKIQQHIHFIKIMYNLSVSIKNKLRKVEKLQFPTFKYIEKMSFRFGQIAKKNHRILGKTQIQLQKQFMELYEQVVKKAFFQNIKKLPSGQIVSVIKNRLNMNKELQNQLVENLFEYLDKDNNKQHLISRIRMPQYITKEIMLADSEIYRQKMVQFIRKVQATFGSLKEFQILRVINISKLLKIESTIFEEYIKHKTGQKQKKQEQIIQNISRTNLREFGIDIMLSQMNKLVSRYRGGQGTVGFRHHKKQPVNIDIQILKSIWYGFKKFQFQTRADNINAVFQFWFSKNYDIIQKVFKKQTNFGFFTNIANKQMTLHNNQSPCSINYEIVVQIFKAWKDRKQHTNDEEYQLMTIETLKNLCQSSNIFLISSKVYRHSYFLKILWAQNVLCSYFYKNKWNYKSKRQIQYIILLLKSSKTSLYRQRPTLSNSILLQTLSQFNFYHEVRMKHFENYTQYWLWLRKNNLSQLKVESDQNWMLQPVSQALNQYFGPAYTFEYLLSMNKIQQNISQTQLMKSLKSSIIPIQILNGTLGKDTVLDEKNLLDMLPISRTLAFLCKKYPNIGDILVQKIMGIKDFVLDYKLVEAANLVHGLAGIVSGQTQLAFDNWIRNTILSLGSPIDNPSLIQLYIKFNIIPQQHTNLVMDFVKSQLKFNNYLLAQTIYLNGFTGLAKQVKQLMHICHANRVDAFMTDLYQKQFVNMVYHFLGLSLIQNQVSLIQQLVALYIEPTQKQIFTKHGSSDTFMLLEVAKLRLNSNEKQQKLIDELLQKLKQADPQIQQKTMNKISACNKDILIKFDIKLDVDESSQLPKLGQKLVYVDYNQPGKNLIVLEYLQRCLNFKNAALVRVQELMRKLNV